MRSWFVVVVTVAGLAGVALGSADESDFSEAEIKSVVQAYVDTHSKDGVFAFKDQRADAVLDLEEDRIRLVRRIQGYGIFVDVDFHAKAIPAKAYDIDFWLKPEGPKLSVVDVRVHKAPKQEGETWKLVTRSPILWWWIPSTEHPGETEEKKSWQLESAVHGHVAGLIKDGVVQLKDDKTGADLALEFVEIHRPLRKLEGKNYFACSDFREKGSSDKYYDIDFWLVEKDGKLEVTDVKVHKEPKQEDGVWIQASRFEHDKTKVKDVP